jgi:4-hydroxy-tetrahydrodipicolinate synthase
MSSASAVVEYFRGLVRHCPLPLFLYNTEPTDSAERFTALAEICKLESVVAIKESSRQPALAMRLLAQDTHCAVFQGWEDCCLASPGVDGYALALVNLEPAHCADMFAAPNQDKQNLLNAHCDRYRLFEDDWYAHMKNELQRRGTLSRQDLVAVPAEAESAPC